MADRNSERKVAVVSGASAGVGRATVREFARRGYAVALLARGEEGLAAARREAEEAGVPALSLPVDVSEADRVRAAADLAEAELGPVDVWVNAAFASVIAPFSEVEPEEFQRVTDVSYHGYVHGTRAALERMAPGAGAWSCKWDRRWATGASPSRPPTAAPSTRSAASPTPSAPSWSTPVRESG